MRCGAGRRQDLLNGGALLVLTIGPLLIAFAIDAAIGDPPEGSFAERWYPPVVLGRAALWAERRIGRDDPRREAMAGGGLWFGLVAAGVAIALALTLLLGPSALALLRGGARDTTGVLTGTAAVTLLAAAYLIVTTLWLKSLFAVRGLVRFCARPLDLPLETMRIQVARVVNRPTSDLPRGLLCFALLESAAENTTDSVVGPLLAFAVLGLPGAVGYRTINTLDALLGHPDRYWRYVGAVAARVDTWVNLLPDALAGGMLQLAAGRRGSRPQIRVFQPGVRVPRTIRSISGVLRVRLEKEGVYVVGEGWEFPTPERVRTALGLVERASVLCLFLSVAIVGGLVYFGWSFFL